MDKNSFEAQLLHTPFDKEDAYHSLSMPVYNTAAYEFDTAEAMEEAFGVAPVNKGEGGSIPFIPELQRIFPKAQVLVTGPEDPKANAHSPNESISLPSLKNNVITEALLLDKLAK